MHEPPPIRLTARDLPDRRGWATIGHGRMSSEHARLLSRCETAPSGTAALLLSASHPSGPPMNRRAINAWKRSRHRKGAKLLCAMAVVAIVAGYSGLLS